MPKQVNILHLHNFALFSSFRPYNISFPDDEDDSFIKRPKQQKVILKRTATADMFFSQEALKLSNGKSSKLFVTNTIIIMLF